jgi:hypothetical protein
MWLADILVNPHDKGKTPIAVVLWGEQGAGKTFLRELMSHLLGETLVQSTGDPRWTGNATLKYKLFVEFEDVNFVTYHRAAGRIKAMICERMRAITKRYADTMYVRASERVLITTATAGKVAFARGDPLFAAFAVSARRVGDTAYWDAHYRKMRSDASAGYVKDVAVYLLSHKDPLSAYSLIHQRPVTEYGRSLLFAASTASTASTSRTGALRRVVVSSGQEKSPSGVTIKALSHETLRPF